MLKLPCIQSPSTKGDRGAGLYILKNLTFRPHISIQLYTPRDYMVWTDFYPQLVRFNWTILFSAYSIFTMNLILLLAPEGRYHYFFSLTALADPAFWSPHFSYPTLYLIASSLESQSSPAGSCRWEGRQGLSLSLFMFPMIADPLVFLASLWDSGR